MRSPRWPGAICRMVQTSSSTNDGMSTQAFPTEESNGWGWQVAFHPEDVPPLMEKWRELLVSGEPGEIEARLRRHDGVYRWFLIRVEPFRDETRKACQVVRNKHRYRHPQANARETARRGTRASADYRRDTADDCCFGPVRRSVIREPGDARLYGSDGERCDLLRTFANESSTPDDLERLRDERKAALARGSIRSRTTGTSKRRPVSLVPDSLQPFPKRARTADSLVRNGNGHR